MKKHLTLLSVLGIVSLLVTGCNFVNPNSNTSQGDKSGSSLPNSSSEPISSSKELQKFTITWKNFDGTVLEVDENVLEGTTPTYDGLAPVKNSDAQYNYVWSGWNPTVEPAKANATYTATFNQELRKYTVVWKNYDGTVLETDNDVPYGTTPEYNSNDPTKDSTVSKSYVFDGWDPAVAPITGDATYTAKFKEETRKYTITWKNYDGTVLKTEEVAYGTTPSYTGDTPTKDSTSHYSYTFDGWTPNVTEVTGDAEYVATYKEVVRTYTITWVNFDGTVLEVDENVEYGVTPHYDGANPSRENERGVNYTWRGWTPTIVPVYRDATYTAKYNSTGYFSFDLVQYELQPGYQESDLKGSPWVNINIQGEIDKIKKPSIKDDFYAGVNYDDIINHVPGPFEVSQTNLDKAINAVNNNSKPTTNGNFRIACLNKMQEGSLTEITNYFNSLDIATYMTSKESFVGPSSYLKLGPIEDGYEVYINDGYIRGNVGVHTVAFYSQWDQGLDSSVKNLISAIATTYSSSLSSTEKSNFLTCEKNISNGAYNYYYQHGSETYKTYTVNTVPYAEMKSALLDMGIASNTKIIIRDYCKDSLDFLYNTYYASYASLLQKSIMIRVGFDYRFAIGTAAYRNLLSYIKSAALFYSESGLSSQTPDAYLVQQLFKISMGGIIEQSYIELAGDAEDKATVISLIENTLQGYREMISGLTWLSQTAKNNILDKLSKMKYEACYSDTLKNIGKIDDTGLNNASMGDLYSRYLHTLLSDSVRGIPEDQFAWAWETMPSYTNNAFYSGGSRNSFIILNGLVTGFLSDTTEEILGMLGFVIGHEISHAFDSNGSHYDAYGYQNDLLTSGDRANYDSKVNKLINFFDSIYLFQGTNAGGSRVNGEAIADMGGIRVMLEVAKNIPDFNYDKFFRAAARTWLTQPYSPEGVQARLSDEHPFAYLRVNVTLAQFDKFIETYDLGPGDAMYVPENQRIAIW